MDNVIQFVPRPNPNREKEQERQAIEIMNIALLGEPTMIGMEPVVYLSIDTAPSEMNPFQGDILGACGPCESATLRISDLPPYVAPDHDSA